MDKYSQTLRCHRASQFPYLSPIPGSEADLFRRQECQLFQLRNTTILRPLPWVKGDPQQPFACSPLSISGYKGHIPRARDQLGSDFQRSLLQSRAPLVESQFREAAGRLSPMEKSLFVDELLQTRGSSRGLIMRGF